MEVAALVIWELIGGAIPKTSLFSQLLRGSGWLGWLTDTQSCYGGLPLACCTVKQSETSKTSTS